MRRDCAVVVARGEAAAAQVRRHDRWSLLGGPRVDPPPKHGDKVEQEPRQCARALLRQRDLGTTVLTHRPRRLHEQLDAFDNARAAVQSLDEQVDQQLWSVDLRDGNERDLPGARLAQLRHLCAKSRTQIAGALLRENSAQDAGDPQAARLRVGSEELADGHARMVAAECFNFRGCGGKPPPRVGAA